MELFLRIKKYMKKVVAQLEPSARNVKRYEESAKHEDSRRMKWRKDEYGERERLTSAELYTSFTGLVHIPSANGGTR